MDCTNQMCYNPTAVLYYQDVNSSAMCFVKNNAMAAEVNQTQNHLETIDYAV